MNTKLFALYDEGARFFAPPIMSPNVTMVARTMLQMEQDKIPANFMQYPKSFVLYEIGEYNEETAQIDPISPPIRHATVSELVEQAKAQFAT